MLTIRPAQPPEHPLLAEVALRQAWEGLSESERVGVARADLAPRVAARLAALLAGAGARAYLAHMNGTLAGCIVLSRTADYLTGRMWGSVVMLYVEPSYRGRGVATRLLAAAEAWGRQHGLMQLEVDVPVAGRGRWAFGRKGYREASRRLVKPLG